MKMHKLEQQNKIINLYKDCMILNDSASYLVKMITDLKRITDSRGKRSTSSEPTKWEIRTGLKLAATQIKGQIVESDWKGKFSNGNLVLINKKTSQTIDVPITKLDEAENEENFDKYKGRTLTRNYGGGGRPNINAPIINENGYVQSQRTLSQSFYDLSNLIATVGALTTALLAVKNGVFGTAITNIITKLKNSRKGLEEAQKVIRTTVK